jgi:uncharacterized phage-like protein YoqJ
VKTICFTGHRGFFNEEWVYTQIRDILGRAVAKGVTGAWVGGALGTDWVALNILKEFPSIAINVALPFYGYDARWPQDIREQYAIDLQDFEPVYVCPPGYAPSKLQTRNEYMVDRSGFVVAVYDKRGHGGTYNCIRYAMQKSVLIYWINPKTGTAQWVKGV